MSANCKICNSINDLRFGVCFTCADLESIIHEGLDMHDKGIDGTDTPAKTAMAKLKFMRAKYPNYFSK